MIASLVAFALSQPPPVAPDRPDVANNTITVAPAAMQLETGLDAELPPQRFEEAPLGLETALRIGVHERAELRLFEGDVLQWATGTGANARRRRRGYAFRPSTLAADDVPLLEFGAKVRLNELDVRRFVPSIGLQPMIGVRGPGPQFRGHIPVAAITLIIMQPLTDYVNFDVNAALRIDANLPAPRVASGLLAGSFSVVTHHRVVVYAELVGIIAGRGARALSTDAGLVVTATRRIAFDVAGRATLVSVVKSYGVIAGMTVLITDGSRRRKR